ncbi:MAG: DUF5696 domain-containing protein, partial [Lachnospiraceae bacterium]|nr:DUF5696 domain-containing protein [Lachnospiraceae bacterium]
HTITQMPYFLSATQEEDGYLVVPDGSGALINFNNGMTNATDYSSRVYGSDVLINADTVDTTDYYANMPVIGVVYEDYAILNIVEEGDAREDIHARSSGNHENYNNAYFIFYITESENVSTSTTSGTSVIKYTGDTYTGDIVLRYQLFTEEKECNYTSLAKNYQEYLVEQGVLTYQEDTEQSLVVELFGSALESKSLMGVPYYGVSSFTSYAEAQEILQALADGGVDSALIQMDGWLDGGESHEVLTSASLESNQGSKKDFNALLSVVEELGYAFYPDVDLQLLHPSFDFLEGGSAKSYAKKYGSRFLDNDYALLKVSDIGTLGKTNWNWTPYLVSPSNLVSYVEKAIKNLSGLGVSGYTVTDLGMNLVADYNEKASVSRISAAVIVQEAIETLSESAEVVMQSPYHYAWTVLTVRKELPTRSCQYSIFNQDIPFL